MTDIFKTLESSLYILANVFIYPVIIGLLFLLGKIFYSLGLFAKEYYRRIKNPQYYSSPFMEQINTLDAEDKILEIELNGVLEKAEQRGFLAIQSSRYSVKMGPTLGLIGTLTPMAKALSGLAQGNLSSLSSQMITAFSTTVIGLVIGGIAYSVMHVRLKWQRQDLYRLSQRAEEKLIGK